MQDVTFHNPTKLIIKKDGSVDIVNFLVQDNIKSVLLLTGKTAVKKIGLFDKITAALKAQNIKFFECCEVRANPEIKLVISQVEFCRKNNVQAILCVGGGSCYDSAKAIAAGAKLPDDVPASKVWEFYEGTRVPTGALPIYGVLTISATASEHNNGGVVQDDEQHKKWSFASEFTFPVVSIVDPCLQVHLPWYQQVNGFVDATVHILEFMTCDDCPEKAEAAFSYNAAMIKTIIKCGDILQKDPKNYDARANFCWIASCALNQYSGFGFHGGDWAVHMMEHAMGAIDPTVSHGAGLGVAFPAFVKANSKRGLRTHCYDRIAKEVYGLEGTEGLIKGFQAQLKKWGHPLTLDELFAKKMGQTERKQLLDIYMMKPTCGYYADWCCPKDIAEDAYSMM
ncbi:alcohol dehydrogenase [Spironucleus salmonicida]|uniref:Alcohol dehydrogenase n=1 Tax=Spironucleus salmonicida TaxID=348837 RepID=V6LUY4_9EUKA|nr:alcohol dehydrogenase [Spironucleus salmonicida]|eukprot:EST48442.1 Alcohol dehydrogenase [Spironucleus salmonicida]